MMHVGAHSFMIKHFMHVSAYFHNTSYEHAGAHTFIIEYDARERILSK